MYSIILWGAGKRSEDYIDNGVFDNCKIIAIVDSYYTEETFKGYPVIKPIMILNYTSYDYIVVINQFYYEIVVKLSEIGIPLDKIIITDNVIEKPFIECYERAIAVLPEIHSKTKHIIKRTIKANELDHIDNRTIFNNNMFKNMEYNHDYYRYRTFEFVSQMIEEYCVEGALAELGVFKGLFSAVLNYRFPDRKLYLFDTFEGFNQNEAEKECALGRCNETFIEVHKNTSVEIMLNNLIYPEQAIVCKG